LAGVVIDVTLLHLAMITVTVIAITAVTVIASDRDHGGSPFGNDV